MRRRILTAIILVAATVSSVALAAPAAYGCSCAEVGVEDALSFDASVAFIGVPIDVRDVTPVRTDEAWVEPRQWTFEVEAVLLGDVPEVIDVGSGLGGGDCGVDFSRSGRVGVVAWGAPGNLSTGICGGVWDADVLLAAYGPGTEPIPVVEAAPADHQDPSGSLMWLWPVAAVVAGAAVLGVLRARRGRDHQDGWRA